jgi:nucleotide-binding universal stress UspA family protein
MNDATLMMRLEPGHPNTALLILSADMAGRVTVEETATKNAMAEARGHLADVVGWLGWHGVEARSVAVLSAGDDVVRPEAIAAEQGADLLVAGAYGHSRVREWVLGGMTRDLLLRAGRAALVSH